MLALLGYTNAFALSGFWTPPENLGNPVNSQANELSGILADSGRALYFSRTDAGQNELYVSIREGNTWGRPSPLSNLNTLLYNELNPTISPDGTLLFFVSDREGGHGGFDIWVATHDGTDWVNPTLLGPAVNTQDDEWHATPGNDGLYLSARTQSGANRGDVLFAEGTFPNFSPRQPIAALATSAREMSAFPSLTGDMLFVTTDRAGGQGSDDVWLSTRDTTGAWHSPVPTPCGLNDSDYDQYPALSADGYTLLFASFNRAGGLGGADLYLAAWHELGDMNGDRIASSLDIIYLVNHLFRGGPSPSDPWVEDPNCDGALGLVDLVILVHYILRSGSAPCVACTD